MSAPSTGFRRLVLVTLAATFALVVVGGVVRLSDSGLGCGPAGSGLHGWPLCRGDVVPGIELNAAVEYSHRTLASAVGVLLIALAVLAWRGGLRRSRPGIFWAAIAGVGTVVGQGLLGAATVELNLDAALVAAHLGIAMVLLGLLSYMRRASVPAPGEGERESERPPEGGSPGRGLRLLSVAASIAVLLTVMAGGYMAGTQKHGRTDHVAGAGAHYACGHDFPACNGAFMPFGRSALADVHLAHRAFMYVAVALVLALAVWTLRRRPSASAGRYALAALGLLALQVVLGALNVWIREEYMLLVLAHLTVGTMLWMSVAGLTLALRPAPEVSSRGARDDARTRGGRAAGEPVTA